MYRVSTCAAATAAFLVFATSASAQATQTTATGATPALELSVGYQLLRAGETCGEQELINGQVVQTCIPDRALPLGFAVDLARHFGSLGIVGEFGWSHDTDEITIPNLGTGESSFNVWHVAGGLRWTFRQNPRIAPYGQFLAGPVITNVNTDLQDFSNTNTNFMVQPGGGIYFAVGGGWGLVGQADLRHVFLDEEESLAGSRNDLRVFLGIRMRLR